MWDSNYKDNKLVSSSSSAMTPSHKNKDLLKFRGQLTGERIKQYLFTQPQYARVTDAGSSSEKKITAEIQRAPDNFIGMSISSFES